MTLDDDMIPDSVLEKASSWAVRLQGAPHDAGLQAALAAWVAENDMHARAWHLTRRAWKLSGHAQPAFAHEWPQRTKLARQLPVAFLRAMPRRFGIRATALAIAACLILFLAWPSIQLRLSADHATGVAESRQIRLDDGSVVTLAPGSAIAVSFGRTGRDVTLLKGEAFFEVVSDHGRPFSVRADELSAIVTGTAFDVGVTDRTFSVDVASGSVRVVRDGAAAEQAVELGAGEGVVVERTTGEAALVQLSPQSVGAWRGGRLIAENAPLTDVVAAIGRYHGGSIVIASAAMRERRVTGVYDLHEPVAALRVLVAPYGGTVRAFTPYLLVLTAD